MYNVLFFAQIFEGRIGCALYMSIIITRHRYDNRYDNPMYNVHKNVSAHYTQQNMVDGRD